MLYSQYPGRMGHKQELFIELKKRYGKESLDVKEYDKEWYDTVENEVKMKTQVHMEEIRKVDFKDICGHEDSDLCVEEIESTLSVLNNNSARSPE